MNNLNKSLSNAFHNPNQCTKELDLILGWRPTDYALLEATNTDDTIKAHQAYYASRSAPYRIAETLTLNSKGEMDCWESLLIKSCNAALLGIKADAIDAYDELELQDPKTPVELYSNPFPLRNQGWIYLPPLEMK